MNHEELRAVLDEHARWLSGDGASSRADLRHADLSGATLELADLRLADLAGANLRRADLVGASLGGADLSNADLAGAYLAGASLRDANLAGAALEHADLRGASLPAFQIPEGELVAWKKLLGGVIAELRVPSAARRTATPVGRKCRCEWAEVVALHGDDGPLDMAYHQAPCGTHIVYVVGGVVRPDSYDDDIRIECTHGIHFFATREEAENY